MKVIRVHKTKHVIKNTYHITMAVKPGFMSTYKNLVDIRKPRGMKTQNVCFYCRKKLSDEDGISLAMVKGMLNQIIHDECCERINEVKP